MLINPEENENFKNFLDDLYENISFFTYSFKPNYLRLKEYQWSIALNYILLKCFGENLFSKHLEDDLSESFEHYKLIFIQKLKNTDTRELLRLPVEFLELYVSFFESNLVNPFVFRKSLFTMRTNMDLKIYFSLFDGKFYPQEQEIFDGTGALYFVKQDFKGIKEGYDSKIKILKDHLSNDNNNHIPCIALNTGHHWVAVESINEKHYVLNNPSSAKQTKISVKSKLAESYRFYLFHYSPKEPFILKESISNFIEKQTDEESLQLEEFTKTLVKSLKDKEEQE